MTGIEDVSRSKSLLLNDWHLPYNSCIFTQGSSCMFGCLRVGSLALGTLGDMGLPIRSRVGVVQLALNPGGHLCVTLSKFRQARPGLMCGMAARPDRTGQRGTSEGEQPRRCQMRCAIKHVSSEQCHLLEIGLACAAQAHLPINSCDDVLSALQR